MPTETQDIGKDFQEETSVLIRPFLLWCCSVWWKVIAHTGNLSLQEKVEDFWRKKNDLVNPSANFTP